MVSGTTDTTQPTLVTVGLADLEAQAVPLDTLVEAFGPDSLGVILVRDLPTEFASLRHKLLSYSSYLANLPADELCEYSDPPSRSTIDHWYAAKLERADAKYAIGWSHGKEKLADGRYDTLKGFYHAQPMCDESLEHKARSLYPDLVEFNASNVWPQPSVLAGFQETYEELCRLIVSIAALVARACDRFGEAKLEGYKPETLEKIVRSSVSTKGRLLHYFPPPPSSEAKPSAASSTVDMASDEDDWCATHCDLGALTGLTAQMFVDEDAHPPVRHADGSFPPLPELDFHPDDKAGLWIRDRAGRTTQVHIPRDCLAFQTGSALELITRGRFKAVPHFVRGASARSKRKIARNTLAVFTQPNLWEMVDGER